MSRILLALFVALVVALGSSTVASAQDVVLKPYALAANDAGAASAQAQASTAALRSAGFRVLGSYQPTPDRTVIAVTNASMLRNAAKTEFGGFGAATRVAITESGGRVQVSFADPRWLAQVYRMNLSNDDVYQGLRDALGGATPFGSKNGLTPGKLRKYHYMTMMPYFDDVELLATHGSHAAAVAAVEKNLKSGTAGASLVYRVDVPGTEQVLFGVALRSGKGSDATVLGACDRGELKQSAYAPYEILVVGGKAYALPGRFRIAQSFPDLSMGNFMKIVSAPGAINEALTAVAGG